MSDVNTKARAFIDAFKERNTQRAALMQWLNEDPETGLPRVMERSPFYVPYATAEKALNAAMTELGNEFLLLEENAQQEAETEEKKLCAHSWRSTLIGSLLCQYCGLERF